MNTKQKHIPAQYWIDCSRPLGPSIAVWPGDRRFEVTQSKAPGFVLSSFSTTCHVGTHVDAPLHIDGSREGVEDIPLERFFGPAEVVQMKNGAKTVDQKALPSGWIPQASRLLLRTDSYPLGAEINGSYVGLEPGFATWLCGHGVKLIGIDTPSVDHFDNEAMDVHHELLEADMTWIEGLWLGGVEPGMYDMIALPMPLVGVEAAPVRVVLRSF
jgi:arylformamidase